MANLLLTGSGGFLGKVIQATVKDYNIINLTKDIVEGQCEGRVDVRFPFQFKAGQNIQTVFHAAGKAHVVAKKDAEKEEFYRVNLEGTKNLCQALEKLDQLPKSFVFISTVAVYGVDKGQSIDENHPLKSTTPYADSKIRAEEWLAQWATKHEVRLSILRLPLIAGPKPPGNLGAMINGIKSGKYLSIGEANARKSIVWAEDIARIIPHLTEKGGIYNLTDGYHPTFGELEEVITAELKRSKPIKIPFWIAKGLAIAGDIVGRSFPINSEKLLKITSTLTFDDSRARRQLGWNPTPVLSRISKII